MDKEANKRQSQRDEQRQMKKCFCARVRNLDIIPGTMGKKGVLAEVICSELHFTKISSVADRNAELGISIQSRSQLDVGGDEGLAGVEDEIKSEL